MKHAKVFLSSLALTMGGAAALTAAGLALTALADDGPGRIANDNDKAIDRSAERMVEQGRGIFRFDTFGSEHFFGDALQLHKAIAGAANGGVGDGISPKTALSVGLKVDSDALPAALKAQ